jgi:hypothetical protein
MEKLRLCSVFSLWGAGARDSNSQKVEMCMGVSGGCESEELVLHTSEKDQQGNLIQLLQIF